MWLLMGLGAIVAGLFLLLREGLPLLEARRSGVMRTRGARAQRVERESEPERFAALLHQRGRALYGPAVITFAGVGWLAINGLGLMLR